MSSFKSDQFSSDVSTGIISSSSFSDNTSSTSQIPEEDLTPSKNNPPKKCENGLFYILFVLLAISILIILTLTVIILFLLFQTTRTTTSQRMINIDSLLQNNNDNTLYDINKIVIQNYTKFVSYDRSYLLLMEGQDPSNFVTAQKSQNKNDMILTILDVSLHEDEHKVQCRGTCECEVEEITDHDRRNHATTMSFYITSSVVVSAFVWAAAKFMGENLEKCYEMARSEVGEDTLLNCAFSKEDSECVVPEEEKEENYKDWVKNGRNFQCDGHCVLSDKAIEEGMTYQNQPCQEKEGRTKVTFVQGIFDAEYSLFLAKEDYIVMVLNPMCEFPCAAENEDFDGPYFKNIICKEIAGPLSGN